jgi:hypothetical protein
LAQPTARCGEPAARVGTDAALRDRPLICVPDHVLQSLSLFWSANSFRCSQRLRDVTISYTLKSSNNVARLHILLPRTISGVRLFVLDHHKQASLV